MKRLFGLILPFALALLGSVVSCKKINEGEGDITFKPATEGVVFVSGDGGSFEVAYTLDSDEEDGKVSATSKADWITVADDSQQGKVVFEASPNDSDTERQTAIEFVYTYSGGKLSFTVQVAQYGKSGGNDGNPHLESLVNGDITAGASGGQYEITYKLTNPAPDGRFEVTSSESWINGFDSSQAGVIKFNVDASSFDDSRRGSVNVDYVFSGTKLSFTVSVVQAGITDAFLLSVSDVKETNVGCTVVPADKEMGYISLVIKQEMVAGFENDDAWFNDDMVYFDSMAGLWGVSRKDLIEQQYLQHGDFTFQPTGLTPDTDYYLYAYGLEFKGDIPERTTDIYKVAFKTRSFEPIEGELRIDVEVAGTTISVIVTPPDDTKYYLDCLNDAMLDKYSGTTEEKIRQHCQDYIQPWVKMGYDVGYVGPAAYSFYNRVPGEKYYPAAMYYDLSDGTVGEVFYKEVVMPEQSAAANCVRYVHELIRR